MTNYSKETQELNRLIAKHCTGCKRCMKDCLFLQEYCESPKELFQTLYEENSSEPELPYSCQMCGRCTVVCPLNLELGEAFLAMRQDLVKNGGNKRPLKQLKSVEFHQFFSSSKWFTGHNQEAKRK